MADADLQIAQQRIEDLRAAAAEARQRMDDEAYRYGGRGPRFDAAAADYRRAQERLETANADLIQLRQQTRADAEIARMRDPAQQARQVALAIGAPVAGLAIGKMLLAPPLKAGYEQSILARNRQLRALAGMVDQTMRAARTDPGALARLRGIVKTADAVSTSSRWRPLALSTAALVVGEGLILRAEAQRIHGDESAVAAAAGVSPDRTASDITRAAGMLLSFAGAATAAAQVTATSLARRVVDAGARARVEIARQFIGDGSLHRAPRVTAEGAVGSMTRAQMADLARRRGVAGHAGMTKAQLSRRLVGHMNRLQGFQTGPLRAAPAHMPAMEILAPNRPAMLPAMRAAPMITVQPAAQTASRALRFAGQLGRGRAAIAGLAVGALAAFAGSQATAAGRAAIGGRARSTADAALGAQAGAAPTGGAPQRFAYENRRGEITMRTRAEIAAAEAQKRR